MEHSSASGKETITTEFEGKVFSAMKACGLGEGNRVIVAVSGGADSVALLVALRTCGFDCIAAHCNFHLRGEESMRDMRHVEALARKLDVDLAVRDFDVKGRMAQSGESLEMACRTLRYEWFDDLLERERAVAIAVGHHREDNVETFFLNLLRGTGINGLTGMKVRNGFIVRPMLDTSREEIEAYLKARGIDFVTDSTNAESHFCRNRLRNRLIPEMERLFPGAVEAVLSTMTILTPTARIYNRAVKDAIESYIDDEGAMDLRRLREECGSDAPLLLYEMIKRYGFNHTHACDALRAASGSGRAVSSSTHRIDIDRGVGRIYDLSRERSAGISPSTVEVSLGKDILSPLHIEIKRMHIAMFRPERDPDTIYLDAECLEGKPVWEIRPPRRGERLRPFGMKGSKLISDLFNDARYTASQKRRARVLTRDGVIIWVIGLRASCHYAVTPATRQFVRLHLVSTPHQSLNIMP